LLTAVLEGQLESVEYYRDPVFEFMVPTTCPDVPVDVMYPSRSWQKETEYWKKYKQLASRFIDNMKKFEADTPKEVIAAGPKI
jgi:phosphoenolpyruvate carboxykinase (ATP)